ncbi:MAG: hypothetical protein JJU13_15340 [Balneolaceae bacterium]|nr:hypothetical protein [Balneolaceae bacterium]
MLFKKYLTIPISIIIFSIVLFTACSDNGATAVDVESGAVINGSVENGTTQDKSMSSESEAEETTVWAASVTSNGSIEKISETETEVDASGEFSLTVDANTANHLAIVAESGGVELKGFISGQIENGQSYTLKPINIQSTAETEVFARIVADGKTDIVHKSDIDVFISSSAGAEIYSNSSAIADLSAAVKNSAEARTGFFAEFESDASAKMDQYFELMTGLQFDYESELSSSTSTDAREAAFEGFVEAKANAYTEAEFELVNITKFLHMQKEVAQNSMESVSSSVRNEVRNSTSIMAAIALDTAVQARAETAGMSGSTISAIADAGSTLRANVSGSGGAEGEINAAFETYHEEVRSAMENDSSVEGTILIAIDTEINAAGGPGILFETAISGLISAQSLNDIYAEFGSSVRNSVEVQSELLGDVDAEAVADILILINLF